eukprot:2191282-Prymnesium_polylepis.1
MTRRPDVRYPSTDALPFASPRRGWWWWARGAGAHAGALELDVISVPNVTLDHDSAPLYSTSRKTALRYHLSTPVHRYNTDTCLYPEVYRSSPITVRAERLRLKTVRLYFGILARLVYGLWCK